MEHGKTVSGMRYGAWGMEHGAWGMEDGAWSMEHGAWGMEPTLIDSPGGTAVW